MESWGILGKLNTHCSNLGRNIYFIPANQSPKHQLVAWHQVRQLEVELQVLELQVGVRFQLPQAIPSTPLPDAVCLTLLEYANANQKWFV